MVVGLSALLLMGGGAAADKNAAAGSRNDGIMGFTVKGAEAQLKLEADFDAALNAKNFDEWMERLSRRPHHTGSVWGKSNAEFIAGLFRSWGYSVEIETYYVLFPTPKLRLLEMVAPVKYTAKLEEPALKEDKTSGQKDEQLPVFNAFSPDGDVTAEIVFVNQGIPQDYEDLERMGIDVKGKLVLAKYGGSWRGIKPKVAQEHGALGVILYSDPEDDGYYQGDDYPKGPFRPATGAQRGSVMDLPMRPGDPLTPYIGATKDAKRLPRDEVKTLLKIPVLPISYSDALPILKALEGPVAPERWRGALPITYHVGPGPAVVHLKLEFNWDLEPAYNVIARLEGSEFPNEWVMRGNHHDAWVNGAADPISGLVALLEEARVVGELAKGGRGPRRSVLYAAWDAEEPALLGSTEWVEDHAVELREKLVAYINTDGTSRGFLFAGGSHGLEAMFNQIAQTVIDPQKNITLAKRAQAAALMGTNKQRKKEAEKSDRYHLRALGSGSDYSPFLQHLGIASFNLGFGGEARSGIYHSIYDSYDHYTRFSDPGFQYGVTLAKVAGRLTLRLANAEVLPFEFKSLARTVARYVDEVGELADDMRKATVKHNKMVADGVFRAYFDPRKPYVEPGKKDPVPHINFAPIQNAMANLEETAAAYKAAYKRLRAADLKLTAEARGTLNKLLYMTERAMTETSGLPRRPWFRHHFYAPGFYTGYGVKTLPGVREAIEKRYWAEADAEIAQLAEIMAGVAAGIDAATATIEGALD